MTKSTTNCNILRGLMAWCTKTATILKTSILTNPSPAGYFRSYFLLLVVTYFEKLEDNFSMKLTMFEKKKEKKLSYNVLGKMGVYPTRNCWFTVGHLAIRTFFTSKIIILIDSITFMPSPSRMFSNPNGRPRIGFRPILSHILVIPITKPSSTKVKQFTSETWELTLLLTHIQFIPVKGSLGVFFGDDSTSVSGFVLCLRKNWIIKFRCCCLFLYLLK